MLSESWQPSTKRKITFQWAHSFTSVNSKNPKQTNFNILVQTTIQLQMFFATKKNHLTRPQLQTRALIGQDAIIICSDVGCLIYVYSMIGQIKD